VTTKDGKREDVRLAAGPVPVARLLARATRPLAGRIRAATARLALDWPQVVGPALAAVTAPERLGGGKDGRVLTIRAAGPVALELQHLAPQLMERINAHLGPGAVVRLKFIQSAPGFAEPQAPPPVPPRRAPDPGALARMQAALAELPEGPLREAMARLGRAIAAR
jgi:hypothetical protein